MEESCMTDPLESSTGRFFELNEPLHLEGAVVALR